MNFITTSGETKVAQKIAANQVLTVANFVFANIENLGIEPVDRVELLPDSANIVATAAISKSGFVSPNKVIYSCLLDTTVGDFVFNWIGLVDVDGVLIACEHIANAIHKIKTVGAVQGNNLARNFLLEFSGAQTITGINTPAEMWQFDFSNRLWQIDERERESNFDIYGQGTFFDTGFLVTHTSGSLFNVAAGIGYVGGIRCYKTSLETLAITGLPTTVYVDASLQGDINGVTAVFSVVASASVLADYVDGQGFKHYVVAIANIAADGTVTDLRKLRSDIYLSKIEINNSYFNKTEIAEITDVYLRKDDQPSQAEAEAGVSTTPRAWTTQRIMQAIAQPIVNAITNGINYYLAESGYFRFPNWALNLTIQWTFAEIPAYSTNYGVSYPLTYPVANFVTIGSIGSIVSDTTTTIGIQSYNLAYLVASNPDSLNHNVFFISIGR